MKPLSIALFVCGIVHFLPAVGVLGSSWLYRLYGTELLSENLTLLMQHRALMFALLGCFFIYAVWQPQLQVFAALLAIISMAGFVFLVGFSSPEPKLHKVVLIDCGVLILLIPALIWHLWQGQH